MGQTAKAEGRLALAGRLLSFPLRLLRESLPSGKIPSRRVFEPASLVRTYSAVDRDMNSDLVFNAIERIDHALAWLFFLVLVLLVEVTWMLWKGRK